MKPLGTEPIFLSPLDEKRFGVPSARARIRSLKDLETTLALCTREGVEFLVARCSTTDLHLIHALQGEHFGLMGTLLYYMRHLDQVPQNRTETNRSIRPAQAGDLDQLRSVAQKAFKGFIGHYHADPRLDRDRCDEAYVDWATRSLQSKDIADETLVAIHEDEIVGFGTLKLNSPLEGEGVLFAVDPRMQKQGILTSLINASMKWFMSRGASRMLYSTQLANLAPQKALLRLGFTLSHSYYTFHKWFD